MHGGFLELVKEDKLQLGIGGKLCPLRFLQHLRPVVSCLRCPAGSLMDMLKKSMFSSSSFGKYFGMFEALLESGLITHGVFAQGGLFFTAEMVSHSVNKKTLSCLCPLRFCHAISDFVMPLRVLLYSCEFFHDFCTSK